MTAAAPGITWAADTTPLALIDRAETRLEWAEASNSLPHHSFAEAASLLMRAEAMLTGRLAFLTRVAAEHCRVAAEAFPAGASAIPYVRAVRDAVKSACREGGIYEPALYEELTND